MAPISSKIYLDKSSTLDIIQNMNDEFLDKNMKIIIDHDFVMVPESINGVNISHRSESAAPNVKIPAFEGQVVEMFWESIWGDDDAIIQVLREDLELFNVQASRCEIVV